MKFNTSKLRNCIREKFGTNGKFAKALGMSQQTLSSKLTGKGCFSQTELYNILKILGILDNETKLDSLIIEYFFTIWVSFLETKCVINETTNN